MATAVPDPGQGGAGLSPLEVDALVHGKLLPSLRDLQVQCDQQLRRQLTDATDLMLRLADALADQAAALSQQIDPYPLKMQTERVRRLVAEALRTNVTFLDTAERVVDNLQLAMINVSTHRFNTQTTPVLVHSAYFPTTLAIDTAIHAPSTVPATPAKRTLAQIPLDMFYA